MKNSFKKVYPESASSVVKGSLYLLVGYKRQARFDIPSQGSIEEIPQPFLPLRDSIDECTSIANDFLDKSDCEFSFFHVYEYRLDYGFIEIDEAGQRVLPEMSPNSTFSILCRDLLSRPRVYDVVYADEEKAKPQFRFFETDGKAARSFAAEQPHSLLIVHSARLGHE